ncbi:hypothetical protein [Aquimarina sp. RZ0]|uniref:hypothetical protein n=1 Tax=Aquimarina sp. RZ0 TaxID=2607730 RepID=UPI0011F0B567|nr:hypothetical protein [Aquimarina sp. RZ0]KAA1242827.1 hypothetical protein F0000_23780 [Aquimarina sp. RZ0]
MRLPRYGEVSIEKAYEIICKTRVNSGSTLIPNISEDSKSIEKKLSPYGFDIHSNQKQKNTSGRGAKKGKPFTTHNEVNVPDGVSAESVFEALEDFVEIFMGHFHQDVKWDGDGLNFTLSHQPFFFQPGVPRNLEISGNINELRPNHHILVEERYKNREFASQDHFTIFRVMPRNGKLIAMANNVLPGIKTNLATSIPLKTAAKYDYVFRVNKLLNKWMELAVEIENKKTKKQKTTAAQASSELKSSTHGIRDKYQKVGLVEERKPSKIPKNRTASPIR